MVDGLREDDCIALALRGARAKSRVIASGAKQAWFRVEIAEGRWKAPDLVLAHTSAILVVEAKVLPGDSFRPGPGGSSDAQVMCTLATDVDAQHRVREAVRRLSDATGFTLAPDPAVYAGLLSDSPYLDEHVRLAPNLLLMSVSGGLVAASDPKDVFDTFF